jgi:serine protease Do
MGLSFATPIDVAIKVAGELRAHGRVIRGRVGVRIQEITPDLATSFGLKSTDGALVTMVEKGSPADKAGILIGDVILKVDGKPIQSTNELPRLIAETAPGTTVTLEIWRRGAVKQITATVGEMQAEAVRPAPEPEQKRANRLGLVVSDLTPAQREALDVTGGVLVRSASGPALKAGVLQGDVIVAINDIKVERVAEFNRLVAKLVPGSTVALLISRRGALVYVPLRLPD